MELDLSICRSYKHEWFSICRAKPFSLALLWAVSLKLYYVMYWPSPHACLHNVWTINLVLEYHYKGWSYWNTRDQILHLYFPTFSLHTFFSSLCHRSAVLMPIIPSAILLFLGCPENMGLLKVVCLWKNAPACADTCVYLHTLSARVCVCIYIHKCSVCAYVCVYISTHREFFT